MTMIAHLLLLLMGSTTAGMTKVQITALVNKLTAMLHSQLMEHQPLAIALITTEHQNALKSSSHLAVKYANKSAINKTVLMRLA
jgi:hypothetical protein